MIDYNNLSQNIENYILNLKKENNLFQPVIKGVTKEGKLIDMGHTCYALKVLYTINSDHLSDNNFTSEIYTRFETFKRDYKDLPKGSYVDPSYYKIYKSNFTSLWIKNFVKFFLRRIKIHEINPQFKFKEYIRAETKQSIATIQQIFPNHQVTFKEFPKTKEDLNYFFGQLDWSHPWNAGAQVSGICVFVSTLENNEDLVSFINDYLEQMLLKDGSYGLSKVSDSSEKVNGAMKVITGLDWLNISIHKPKELIDLCLKHNPNSEGCDIVDIIYVLYKCHQQTDYKSEEIREYFKAILHDIEKHYYQDIGGFSYFLNKSQTHYYGIQTTKGLDEPDIHGTTLLVWGLSMIFSTLGDSYPQWNVIKP